MGEDPWAYLNFVVRLVAEDQWDVLFPTHEQAFLFSRERARIPQSIALAVADFGSFLQVQGKAALVKTLSRLSIPQPVSHVIRTQEELESESHFPFYLKANYSTASTAVWRIHTYGDLKSKTSELTFQALLDGEQEFVVQEAIEGSLERVQAIFDRGKLIAIHGYRQMTEGVGGGDISKVSVRRPAVHQYVERLGEQLQWHGALSLDYVFQEDTQTPLFIDANPRLVEPMNAVFSGVNLADILVRLSIGQPIATEEPVYKEIRTHMLLMALLSAAATRRRRLDIIVEFIRVIARRGLYADSREELLPVQIDFRCAFPLLYVLTRLFLKPESADALSAASIASYSLSPTAARRIANVSSTMHPP